MTAIRPFSALRYDLDRVDLSKVIVPPYDVIAADERGDFFDRDPHNAIRFELTRDAADEATTDYSEIAQTLAVQALAWPHVTQVGDALLDARVPALLVEPAHGVLGGRLDDAAAPLAAARGARLMALALLSNLAVKPARARRLASQQNTLPI